jgi:lipopolysaccharide export system permease protein
MVALAICSKGWRMTLLGRYVMRQVLTYTVMVMLLLMVLVGLYLFIDQANEFGTGRFGAVEALVVVMCRIPEQAFTLLPVGGLMGAMLALGNLARNGELVVMRASGMSVFRLAGWTAAAGLVLAVLTWGIGDYIAPPASQFAAQYKLLAKTNQYVQQGGNQWAKDGNTFVFVQKQDGQSSLGGVYVLRFDERRRLLSVGKAAHAEIARQQQWLLKDYVESRFTDRGVEREAAKQLPLKTSLLSEYLGAANADPDSLTAKALLGYIAYLEQNHLVSDEYLTAFWSRVARTVALIVIVVLAVPFSFGPMRSTGTGTRMVIGILVGAVFFLLAKLLSNAGVVYGIDPLIVAWGPTVIMAAVTMVALARVR